MLAAAMGTTVWVASAAQVSLNPVGFENRLYTTTPPNIPGTSSNPQSKALTPYGGNVGAAGKPSTPNNGTLYLVQSAFGQPVEAPSNPDFLFGQEIIPNPALAADLGREPIIDPVGRAIYIPDARKVFAAEPGYVQITWKKNDGSPVGPVRYLIGNVPFQNPPVAVYHTHNPDADLTVPIPPPPQTRAPLVDLHTIQQVIIHYNSAIPADSFVLSRSGSVANLFAKQNTGLILLEYRENGQFLSVETVAVRSDRTLDAKTPADIGFALTPALAVGAEADKPKVTLGLDQINPNTSLVYQHDSAGSPQDGFVYPIRRAGLGSEVEVYWMKKGFRGIVWPYELHQYTADWPTDLAHFQLYVRGESALLGPSVTLPDSFHSKVMPFQEPAGHAPDVDGVKFSTTGPGWSLLKYSPSNAVYFQVVRSVAHTDNGFFNLTSIDWDIGKEIKDAFHQGPSPGYIHVSQGNRYDWEIYDGNTNDPPTFKTSQIFGVNEGILEIWWANLNLGVQWPSLVKRYNNVWPASASTIVIASLKGGGAIDLVTQRNYRLYFQNDPGLPGFNPNDEHALIEDGGAGPSVFALRDDLGTPTTSKPYSLLKYQGQKTNTWSFTVYKVVAEQAPFFFNYPAVAATQLQPPFPLSLFQLCPESSGVSGPYFRDRKQQFWARAAGNDGGDTNIVLRFFYPVQDSFFFPDAQAPAVGDHVPWLDRRPLGTPGVPTDITFDISWPDAKELRVAETLVKPKFGLPDIAHQTSVEIVYDQSVANSHERLVRLIDPTREFGVDLAALPGDVTTASQAGKVFFPTLPPYLRERFFYDPTIHKLKFRGQFVEPPAGEYYLLMNVISSRDRAVLLGLSHDAAFLAAVNQLAEANKGGLDVLRNATSFDSLALTAGFARGTGYVTLAFGNNGALSPVAEPVSLEVIKVTCPTYQGEIKVIPSGNPFDEKITLRHSGDFAGQAENYIFEWRTRPPVDGLPPSDPPDLWTVFTPKPGTGEGSLDITIEGSGLFTLTDNYFICRYRPKANPVCTDGSNPQGWSDWTAPQLAEGWIKRVVRGINPFEQRIQAYQDNQVNTIVSMISQAGARSVGSVPLSQQAANDFGLIEIYETVLKRGIALSIEGAPAVDYGPANDALLLVAGRLADLYMLLGNEAYADAADPTIAFGTDDKIYGSEATSIHCFMNQTPSLLEEELALLRGRDNSLLPSVQTYPFYNRLIWNFTSDLSGGEVAYALNYNIRDVNGDVAGTINEADARKLYPQGHGDAWGHYLMAVKNYYRLLRNDHFTWVPRIEAVLVGGVPVSVDFLDERKFAVASAALARTGSEIVNLTYRGKYVEDPTGQWQGYQDTDADRAWGLSEWGLRAGQGALINWVVANALLPSTDENPSHTGIQKIDRTTVRELNDIASAFVDVQAKVDMADAGLNPLGLAQNVVPFDIDPTGVAAGKTHFEQIYDRAVSALNNAISVFNHANNSSQLLRRQADSVSDFQKNVDEREADFNSRLIEAFGYPYTDDIGPTGTYPSGYDGPDLYHYDYVDVADLVGVLPPLTQVRTFTLTTDQVNPDGSLGKSSQSVSFHVSTNAFGLVKPAFWTGKRRAPGEIQLARADLIQSRVRLEKGLEDYDHLLNQIDDQSDLARAQYGLNRDEILILNHSSATQSSLNKQILNARLQAAGLRAMASFSVLAANSLSEALPTDVGFSVDATSVARGAIRMVGSMASQTFTADADSQEVSVTSYQQKKEEAQAETNIELTTRKDDFALQQSLAQLKQLIRQETSMRLELYGLRETIQQNISRYEAALAKGQRILDDRLRFRQQTAAQVQAYRYKDMAFRIFRNDALQKYRAQFDLAAQYVYLTARAYDYETNLRKGDPRGPGQDFMTAIIRSRSLGLVENGLPHTGSGQGDAGLADPMARLIQNWNLVLKGQLGFNNPQTETGRFSLRSEFLRIQAGAQGSAAWREALTRFIVPNLLEMEEFKRYCIPFTPQQPVEPAIVIPFDTTINFGENFFGWPAGGGDNDYDSTHFATKIRSVGVWFANYNNLVNNGMINTPRVYLVPVGVDIMRSPTDNTGAIREWRIVDQALPVPFPLSLGDLSNPDWIPSNDTLAGQLADIRRFPRFRAYHDSGNFDPSQTVSDTRLIGRSVWNSRWLLIIPGGTLHSDRNEGIQRFINGNLVGTRRDNNGVSDIKIFFQTYAYSGN